ncbi:MAG: sulfurtransferase TusA family protein [Proteobacteria bacterium]|nr:sulfurtransferase TusA family protein [Pseudomonadota bacterium]MCL2307206.1 sulfurtransferase TusA family protein [Pseudomonadota bacterium]
MSVPPSVFELSVDRELDACGLNCPLPILRAKKALSEMVSGQTLRITATDPGSVGDFQSFAKQTGNVLSAQGENADGVFGFVLQRK